MKRLIISAVLLLGAITATFGENVVARGQTFTSMGDYVITRTDDAVTMLGKECQAYTIRYENSAVEVRVIVCKTEKCKRYVVISDQLSVQYVCNKSYFGVERLGKMFESEGLITTDKNLNRFEYFHQKVLGPGQKSELEATSLIAAYFPFLLVPEARLTAAI